MRRIAKSVGGISYIASLDRSEIALLRLESADTDIVLAMGQRCSLFGDKKIDAKGVSLAANGGEIAHDQLSIPCAEHNAHQRRGRTGFSPAFDRTRGVFHDMKVVEKHATICRQCVARLASDEENLTDPLLEFQHPATDRCRAEARCGRRTR